jgi:hypothetical protein
MYDHTRNAQTFSDIITCHEVYLRLIDDFRLIQVLSGSHLFGIAVRIKRMVLVDHARARFAELRGTGGAAVAPRLTEAPVSRT